MNKLCLALLLTASNLAFAEIPAKPKNIMSDVPPEPMEDAQIVEDNSNEITTKESKETTSAEVIATADKSKESEDKKQDIFKANNMDIDNFLNDAKNYYKGNNIASAIDSLEAAEIVLRDIQSKDMQKILSSDIDGWQEVKDDGDVFFRPKGVSYISKLYSDGIDEIRISVYLDSPKLVELVNMASQDDNGKKNGIGDYKGFIKKFDRTANKNSLLIVTGIDALVEISGYQLSHTNALKVADSFDINSVVNFNSK